MADDRDPGNPSSPSAAFPGARDSLQIPEALPCVLDSTTWANLGILEAWSIVE
jgi:hypothetical protein